MHLHEGIDRLHIYWIANERAVSTKVQWTDSLGVAQAPFPDARGHDRIEARDHRVLKSSPSHLGLGDSFGLAPQRQAIGALSLTPDQ